MLEADVPALAEMIYDAAINKAAPGDRAYRPFTSLAAEHQQQFEQAAKDILERDFDLSAAQIEPEESGYARLAGGRREMRTL
jgi:hypothetical protein